MVHKYIIPIQFEADAAFVSDGLFLCTLGNEVVFSAMGSVAWMEWPPKTEIREIK